MYIHVIQFVWMFFEIQAHWLVIQYWVAIRICSSQLYPSNLLIQSTKIFQKYVRIYKYWWISSYSAKFKIFNHHHKKENCMYTYVHDVRDQVAYKSRLYDLNWITVLYIKKKKVKSYSRGWFRSTDLWVMGPTRFRCATLLTKGTHTAPFKSRPQTTTIRSHHQCTTSRSSKYRWLK